MASPSRSRIRHEGFTSGFACYCFLAFLFVAPSLGQVQTDGGRDVALLRAVYFTDSPVVAGMLDGANRLAWPAFAGVPSGLLVASLASASGVSARLAARVMIAEFGAAVTVVGLKRLVRRPRPYEVLPDIQRRARAGTVARRSYSFPSGHAALGSAAAMALSVYDGRWFVITPAWIFAAAISTSRLWLGVHYPSDVLAGTMIGAGLAVAVYLIDQRSVEDHVGSSMGGAPLFSFVVAL